MPQLTHRLWVKGSAAGAYRAADFCEAGRTPSAGSGPSASESFVKTYHVGETGSLRLGELRFRREHRALGIEHVQIVHQSFAVSHICEADGRGGRSHLLTLARQLLTARLNRHQQIRDFAKSEENGLLVTFQHLLIP